MLKILHNNFDFRFFHGNPGKSKSGDICYSQGVLSNIIPSAWNHERNDFIRFKPSGLHQRLLDASWIPQTLGGCILACRPVCALTHSVCKRLKIYFHWPGLRDWIRQHPNGVYFDDKLLNSKLKPKKWKQEKQNWLKFLSANVAINLQTWRLLQFCLRQHTNGCLQILIEADLELKESFSRNCHIGSLIAGWLCKAVELDQLHKSLFLMCFLFTQVPI